MVSSSSISGTAESVNEEISGEASSGIMRSAVVLLCILMSNVSEESAYSYVPSPKSSYC